MQRGRGHCAFYYTSPQSFIKTNLYSLAQQLWGLLLNFDCLIHLGIQTLQPLIVIYTRGNLMYHHWVGMYMIVLSLRSLSNTEIQN